MGVGVGGAREGGGVVGGASSYPRPAAGSRSPPPIPGRISPINSQSRGGVGHTQNRAQTQL